MTCRRCGLDTPILKRRRYGLCNVCARLADPFALQSQSRAADRRVLALKRSEEERASLRIEIQLQWFERLAPVLKYFTLTADLASGNAQPTPDLLRKLEDARERAMFAPASQTHSRTFRA